MEFKKVYLRFLTANYIVSTRHLCPHITLLRIITFSYLLPGKHLVLKSWTWIFLFKIKDINLGLCQSNKY